MLFFPCWVMVGVMTTGVRSRHRPAIPALVAGLVALALMVVVNAPAWHGGGPHERSAADAKGVLTDGTWMTKPSAEQLAAIAPHHGPVLWAVRMPVARVPVPPALIDVWHDPDTIRSPQQAVPRDTGSRSPPGIGLSGLPSQVPA